MIPRAAICPKLGTTRSRHAPDRRPDTLGRCPGTRPPAVARIIVRNRLSARTAKSVVRIPIRISRPFPISEEIPAKIIKGRRLGIIIHRSIHEMISRIRLTGGFNIMQLILYQTVGKRNKSRRRISSGTEISRFFRILKELFKKFLRSGYSNFQATV